MEEFAKAKEDNGMMNIKDVLSTGEEVLFGKQQHRFVPGLICPTCNCYQTAITFIVVSLCIEVLHCQ